MFSAAISEIFTDRQTYILPTSYFLGKYFKLVLKFYTYHSKDFEKD